MRVAVFSTKPYDHTYLTPKSEGKLELTYLEPRLDANAAPLADGCEAACVFVNDLVNAEAVASLAEHGVRVIATRSAGFNHIDVEAAAEHEIPVARVPAYSPHGVAEHAVALMLTLNRKTHRAFNRVRESNFSINGLLGFDMHGKTVGVVGTGTIGAAAARILVGFGCRVIAFDVRPNPELVALGVQYVTFEQLIAWANIITLHCPLLEQTYHLIDRPALEAMRDDVMLINTSRGALVDTEALIGALKEHKVGSVGLDVYEEEEELFFEDRSGDILQDDEFARLLSFPNVLITGHQAFFTTEALEQIAEVTVDNLVKLLADEPCENVVHPKANA